MSKAQPSTAAEDGWAEVLTEPAELIKLVVGGNGKRPWLRISFTEDRWIFVPVRGVKLATEGKVNLTSTVESVDDSDLNISYTGEDIEVRSVRLCCYWDDDDRAVVEEWKKRMVGRIHWVVDSAEIVIAPVGH